MKRISKVIIMIALALSIGLHWVVLQSVAWVGMFVEYSADYSLTVAIDKTFDVDNKCDLCKVVADGTEPGEKSETTFQLAKLKGINDVPATVVDTPAQLEFGLLASGPPISRSAPTPTPPPPVA